MLGEMNKIQKILKSMDNVTPQLLLGHLIVVVRIFLGGMNKEHWEFMPRVYTPSRVTPCMKIILVAHLKQADAYIYGNRDTGRC